MKRNVPETLTINRPSDFHTHLRSPAQVGAAFFQMIVEMNCTHYQYVVVEPNTYLNARRKRHHIENAHDLDRYRAMVTSALPKTSYCIPLFLIKLTPKTTPQMITDAASTDCVGVKLYPEGVTTGSQHGGVSDFFSPQLYACLEQVRKLGLVFQIHPEMPHTFSMQREHLFHSVLEKYAKDFPGLKIFVEHVTDRRTLALIHTLRANGNTSVYATITGHHLQITLDNVLGQVDHHCWPCAKEPEDRAALIEAATGGYQHILSITDSAPHEYQTKHFVTCACAGVFNPAHIAIPLLVNLFEKTEKLDHLNRFATTNGLAAYGLDHDPKNTITLIKNAWEVPGKYSTRGQDHVTPFMAGQRIPWMIKES